MNDTDNSKLRKLHLLLSDKKKFYCDFFRLIQKRHGIRKIVIFHYYHGLEMMMLRMIFAKSNLVVKGYCQDENIDENDDDVFYLYLKNINNCNRKNYFELDDLIALGDWGKYEHTKIPRIINTIENCYSKIGIIGTDSFTDNIFQYLKENKHIIVEKIDEALRKDNLYRIEKEYDIILNFGFNHMGVTNKKGNHIFTYGLKDYYLAVSEDSDFDC